MNKTININPDLFSFSSSKGGSRKKRNKPETPKDIKIKPNKEKTKTVRKQHILRFLRQKQEDNYKKLMEGDAPKCEKKPVDTTFNSEFDESLRFLKDVTASESSTKHNFTSKNYSSDNSLKPIVSSVLTPIDIDTRNTENQPSKISLIEPTIQHAATPVWGCMKNGNLPTFRDWKQSTQKVYPTDDKKHEITSMMRLQKKTVEPRLYRKKQRRTVRRTYNVGKKNGLSKVSVLVSNKTIRNNIMNKTQEIKHKPIEEMKRYLIKRGFIRVGTSAPNDVIGKMFESANLVCGEIENHNADNLLFNYVNDVDN